MFSMLGIHISTLQAQSKESYGSADPNFTHCTRAYRETLDAMLQNARPNLLLKDLRDLQPLFYALSGPIAPGSYKIIIQGFSNALMRTQGGEEGVFVGSRLVRAYLTGSSDAAAGCTVDIGGAI